MSDTARKELCNYLLITVGTGLMALAVQWMYVQIGLVTGGFTGLAIVVRSLTSSVIQGGIPLWLTNIGLNLPVFCYAYVRYGRRMMGKAVYGAVMLSVWLYLSPVMDFSGGDYMRSALLGGTVGGIGIGMVLKAGATTGGTDLVAVLLRFKMRHYTVAQIMQVLDGAIVLMGMYAFGLRPSFYAVLAILVTSRVSDALLEGFRSSKAALVITNRYAEVANNLMAGLERGVTGLEAKGMYTGTYKCVLYCVVSRKEIFRLKEIVRKTDPDAFVIVSEVREVLGEGFLDYDAL